VLRGLLLGLFNGKHHAAAKFQMRFDGLIKLLRGRDRFATRFRNLTLSCVWAATIHTRFCQVAHSIKADDKSLENSPPPLPGSLRAQLVCQPDPQ